MIPELKFARSFTSVWRQLIPGAEAFVRQINLQLYKRWDEPLKSKTSVERRALINEAGFCLFCHAATEETHDVFSYSETKQAVKMAAVRIMASGLVGSSLNEDVDDMEVNEIQTLANRLCHYFDNAETLIIEPCFQGAGIINECNGDILFERCLFEIKSGDRSFRSIDLRQVTIYLALNYAGKSHPIDRVCFLNPRRGTSFVCSSDELARQMSGLSAAELFGELIEDASELAVSG